MLGIDRVFFLSHHVDFFLRTWGQMLNLLHTCISTPEFMYKHPSGSKSPATQTIDPVTVAEGFAVVCFRISWPNPLSPLPPST